MRFLSVCLIALSLTGCASMFAPSADRLATLPVVAFPDQPPTGDFIFKLPAGQPIPVNVAIKGSLLAKPVTQSLTSSLTRDLYVHKGWVSEDRKTWKRAGDVVGVNLSLSLPSDEYPKPGEIVLAVDRKP